MMTASVAFMVYKIANAKEFSLATSPIFLVFAGCVFGSGQSMACPASCNVGTVWAEMETGGPFIMKKDLK